MTTMRINLKWMATQFLRDNPKLADDGETCVFIDEPGVAPPPGGSCGYSETRPRRSSSSRALTTRRWVG
jgi:hypothetical protein